MTRRKDQEDRRQQRLRRFRTRNPRCVVCGESDPAVLELHHIAGRANGEELAIVCANHHRKLSDQQRDHVPPGSAKPEGQLGRLGHFLLGLADLLVMIVEALRKFAAHLMKEAMGKATP
jgi:hypothetical protein